MNFEFILTFDGRPQQFVDSPFTEDAMRSEQAMFDHVCKELAGDEIADLRKISSCIYMYDGRELPAWYKECNGKIYVEHGQLV